MMLKNLRTQHLYTVDIFSHENGYFCVVLVFTTSGEKCTTCQHLWLTPSYPQEDPPRCIPEVDIGAEGNFSFTTFFINLVDIKTTYNKLSCFAVLRPRVNRFLSMLRQHAGRALLREPRGSHDVAGLRADCQP